MGYNTGLSAWSHSHVLLYANGKRAILTMRGRRWRAEPLEVEAPDFWASLLSDEESV